MKTELPRGQDERLERIRVRHAKYADAHETKTPLHTLEGETLSDDELVVEMNTTAKQLVREWYCESQHRDELVDEITIVLTAAYCLAETTAATAMRDKCVEKVREIAADYRRLRKDNANIIAHHLDGVANQIQSLTLDQVKPGEM